MERTHEIIAEAPAGGTGEIDDEIDNLLGAIDGQEIGLEYLLDAIKGGNAPAAIVKEIKADERVLEGLRSDLGKLMDKREAAIGLLVEKRLVDLREALTDTPLDRGLVNRLLRQLMSGVVIDYASGRLLLRWHQGGETAITYGWPRET